MSRYYDIDPMDIDPVEVTQADRDAVRSWYEDSKDADLCGTDLAGLEQAFARYRTSLPTRDAAIEEAAKVARDVLEQFRQGKYVGGALTTAIEKIDAALSTRTFCTMGVGCDEAGVCYADAHGEPDRCTLSTPTSGEASAPPPLSEGNYRAFQSTIEPDRWYVGTDRVALFATEIGASGEREARLVADLLNRNTTTESGAGAREDVLEKLDAAIEQFDDAPDERFFPAHLLDWTKDTAERLRDLRAALASSPTEQMLREALERLLRRFNDEGLHIVRLDLPVGSQREDVEFARQALERNQS